MPWFRRLIVPNSRKNLLPAGKFTCGVYEISHKETNKRYVGSSDEVEKRLSWHIMMLRNNRHHCPHLQNVWNKYGESGFEFFLLEKCKSETLESREQHHLDLETGIQLMNCCLVAGSKRGYKSAAETRAKIAEGQSKFSSLEEEKLRRSERVKKQHESGRFGRRTWGKKSFNSLEDKARREAIVADWLETSGTNRDIAIRHGVCPSTVRNIIKKHRRNHANKPR